jgi:hypothetical protein
MICCFDNFFFGARLLLDGAAVGLLTGLTFWGAALPLLGLRFFETGTELLLAVK